MMTSSPNSQTRKSTPKTNAPRGVLFSARSFAIGTSAMNAAPQEWFPFAWERSLSARPGMKIEACESTHAPEKNKSRGQLWCGCQHKSTPRSVHADETAHCTCCRRRPHDYNLSSSIGGGKWRAAPGPAARSRDGVHTNALTQALPTARASTPRASSPHHWRPCGHRVTSSRVSLWRTDGLLGPALSARPPGDVPQWLSVSRPAGMSPRAGRNLIIPLPFQSISTRPSPTPESIGGSGLRNTTASGPLHRTHLI